MRPLCVTFKRFALLAGRGARAMAALVELTPQRFDLIWLLRDGPMIQRDLAFEMGVVRSVVSKMVTALEQLGIVERRGVEGDKRLRLVVLTQRAFDIMRYIVAHRGFDFEAHGIQSNAEHVELDRFRPQLKAEKVGVDRLSCRDHRELLAKMRTAIDRTTPAQYVGFAPFDPSIMNTSVAHARWRNTRAPWRVDGGRGDARFAKEHMTAGIPLDALQRVPLRKRGRRARATAEANFTATSAGAAAHPSAALLTE